MKIAGSNTIPHPVDRVWDALLDPAVLVRTLPGCERLVATDDHHYDMTVTAGVAAIRGTYDGTCALSDLVERESLTMRLQGAGAPGTVDATVAVRFEPASDGTTVVWDADAVVGGMVGGVGQRMLGSVSTRMAGEFFGNVSDALSGPVAGAAPSVEPVETTGAAQRVFTAPPRAGGRDDFLRGIAVGAGLVLLGVVAGGIFGRRRS
ncbi:SRPBCC family protein [Nocardioides taihuensis]|uniref:Carbon monoxide dehydrogenase subunit G n=1 Tax=Nocardioides taihuensis TaxID=1835606 RepID=A0ABW0BLW2_9ACTN